MLKVLSVFEKLNIKDESLILSVSGGVDSMSLLSCLNKSSNYNLVVVHFNHQTRKENKDEETLVKEFCDKNGIPFYTFKVKVSSGNFQSKAREQRLARLKEIAIKHNTSYIVTAHHLDDLVETMIMRSLRKNHILSQYGFESVSIENDFTFVKPLLTTFKSDIYNYARDNNVPFLEDPTNLENIYFRNKVRNKTIPKLEKTNINFKNDMLSVHYLLLDLKNLVRNKSLVHLNGNKQINLDEFNMLDSLLKEDILTYLLNDYNVSSSMKIFQRIFKAIANSKPNITVQITKHISFIKSYNVGYFKTNKIKIFNKKQLKQDEIIKLNNSFSIIYTKREPKDANNWSVLWYNNLMMPLNVRLRENGDKLAFHYGTKKLKDFFIDEKVPKHKRDTSFVITDANNNVLWIPFLYLNQTLGNQNKLFLKIIRNNQEEDNHEQETT